MRKYVLDTNVLIADLRNAPILRTINETLNLQAEVFSFTFRCLNQS
ncbi:MAG: hypothetical protein AAF587_43090 [Bacteroidota bacterium]